MQTRKTPFLLILVSLCVVGCSSNRKEASTTTPATYGAGSFFSPGSTIAAKKMYVETVDCSGNPIGDGKWVDIPEPDRFPSGGFSRLEEYVARLLRSKAKLTSLIIATADQQNAMFVSFRDDLVQLHLCADTRPIPGTRHVIGNELAIRSYFKKLRIDPTEDYLAGNGGVKDATRCLTYPVIGDAKHISDLCISVFRDVFCVGDEKGIMITYQER